MHKNKAAMLNNIQAHPHGSWFSAYSPEFPSMDAVGETKARAIQNLKARVGAIDFDADAIADAQEIPAHLADLLEQFNAGAYQRGKALNDRLNNNSRAHRLGEAFDLSVFGLFNRYDGVNVEYEPELSGGNTPDFRVSSDSTQPFCIEAIHMVGNAVVEPLDDVGEGIAIHDKPFYPSVRGVRRALIEKCETFRAAEYDGQFIIALALPHHGGASWLVNDDFASIMYGHVVLPNEELMRSPKGMPDFGVFTTHRPYCTIRYNLNHLLGVLILDPKPWNNVWDSQPSVWDFDMWLNPKIRRAGYGGELRKYLPARFIDDMLRAGRMKSPGNAYEPYLVDRKDGDRSGQE